MDQTKIPVPGGGYVHSSSWSMGSNRCPQTTQFIATALGYPAEFDNKTLLLKIPYSPVIVHGETKLVLAWKLWSYWLPFIMLAVSMHATWGEKSLTILLSYEPYKLS